MKIIIKKSLLLEELLIEETFEQKIYEFKFSISMIRDEEEFINFSKIKDEIRGIENVTIVRTEQTPAADSKYDVKYLIVKAEFNRGDDIKYFLNNVLIPKIKQIPEFKFGKTVSVKKVAQR